MGNVFAVAKSKIDEQPKACMRLLVCDSTLMFGELLASFLKSDVRFDVLGVTTDSASLVDAVRRQEPEIVIISAKLADGPAAGINAVRQMRAMSLSTCAIVLLDDYDKQLALEAYRCGAKGVVFRLDSLETLLSCIQRVSEGEIWANQMIIVNMLSALSGSSNFRVVDAKGADLLTTRQKQLVSLVAEGMSNKEISEQLGLSQHTIKNYLFRIFDKLGVSSRAELIVYALNQQNMEQQRKAQLAPDWMKNSA
jgi:DNA-binding NarL/FixJ family response regulator